MTYKIKLHYNSVKTTQVVVDVVTVYTYVAVRTLLSSGTVEPSGDRITLSSTEYSRIIIISIHDCIARLES